MTPLVWHAVSLHEWAAWYHLDRSYAKAQVTIEKTHLGYRVQIRSVTTYEVVLSAHLQHSQFQLADAQRLADILIAGPLPLEDESVVAQVLATRDEALARSATGRRCTITHAFPVGAGDDAICQCGRVTKGWLKQQVAS